MTDERVEFVVFAVRREVSLAALCRRFGVSRPTGHKWRRRFEEQGRAGLVERSRRPRRQPARVPGAVEQTVCALAAQHPAWGARKLKRRLADLGRLGVPAPSTIQRILERNGIERVRPPFAPARQRFEMDAANALWQMDFKGHFPLAHGRCHALTVLDDHSRFSITLASCGDERWTTVQAELTRAFERYGLPERILTDNGSPWGYTAEHPHTRLTAWLLRLGVRVSHGRPYHPQTQGKDERFHRTLDAEVLARRPQWPDLDTVQRAFDDWRHVYNFERPHEALAMATPASRYAPSVRALPAVLPPFAYGPADQVRRVRDHGEISFRGREYLVGRAFAGDPVALRVSGDGTWDIYYAHQRVAQIDLRDAADMERMSPNT